MMALIVAVSSASAFVLPSGMSACRQGPALFAPPGCWPPRFCAQDRAHAPPVAVAAGRANKEGPAPHFERADGRDASAPVRQVAPAGRVDDEGRGTTATLDKVATAPDSAEAAGADGGVTLDDIQKKVLAGQKELLSSGEGAAGDSLEQFLSAPAPEEDVVLSGRIPGKWLEVDFSCCLGKGGYGDVYEGRIVGGPLKGSHVVAKRAHSTRSKGKIRWRRTDAAGNSFSVTASGSGSDSAEAGGVGRAESVSGRGVEGSGAAGSSGTASGAGGNAVEYLEVEDYVNRIISLNCPQIAAEYIGDCYQDISAGAARAGGVDAAANAAPAETKTRKKEVCRWLVWHFEAGALTLSDMIQQAHTHGYA